ncbi:unnamed protein product, partial [Ectocarpus sp. 8 AP-2014]
QQVNGSPPAARVIAGGEGNDGRSEGTASSSSSSIEAKSEADAKVDAALVKVRQKAFLKRVVELGLRGRAKEVLDMMEDVKSERFPPFNIYMYNACITALARCGRWRQALAILDHMRFTANAAEAAAATALEADPAAGIDGGAAMLPPAPAAVRPDVFSYSAAITACGNCGEWRRALALLRVMREQGVPPNVVSYNAAAHACVGDQRKLGETRMNGNNGVAEPRGRAAEEEKEGEEEEEEGWALVLGLMEEMRAEGVAPDVFTFTTAITACGKAGQWERALDLLEEMGGGGDGDDRLRRRRTGVLIAPDVASINAAISACARAGQWESALGLLGRMAARAGGGLVSSSAGGVSSDDDDDAEQGDAAASSAAFSSGTAAAPDLRGSSGRGSSRDTRKGVGRTAAAGAAGGTGGGAAWPAADAVSFNSAMEACAIAGRWREGTALLPRMLKVGVRPDVCSYGGHLACLRAGGQWQRAVEVLDEMTKAAPKAGTGIGGSGEEAAGVSPDLGCYAAVISTLGEAGRWKQALDLLRFLQRKGSSAATLGEEPAAREERAAGWDALAAEARGGGAAISSSPAAGPNLVCYNAALTACARAREGSTALDLLEEMEGRGVFDTESFNCAMLACRGKGQWHKATAILDRMVSGDAVQLGEGSGGTAGGTAAGEGGWGARLRTTVPRPDAYSFASAITACGDVGRADVALELLRKMKSAGAEPNVVVFNAVIRAVSRGIMGPAFGATPERAGVTAAGEDESAAGDGYAAAGRGEGGEKRGRDSWRRAYFLLVEMREAGLTPEVKTYNTVLAVCQRAEAWEGALEVLEEMKSGTAKRPARSGPRDRDASAHGAAVSSWIEESAPPPDLVSFNTAMGACGKAGQWEKALSLLEEIADSGFAPNAISYNTAAAACARAEEWDRAQEVVERGREAGVIAAAGGVGRHREVDQDREGPGERDDGVASVDMSGFYATIEEMLRRQKRGRHRSRQGGNAGYGSGDARRDGERGSSASSGGIATGSRS